MFEVLKRRNLVSIFSRPLTKQELKLCGFAFVDDSDIIAMSDNVNDPAHTVQRMQETLDCWEATAKVTGGALEPNKSFGYLIYFQWNKGKWSYGQVKEEYSLTALDKDNNRRSLKMQQPHQALKMLGVHLAPDGNDNKQYRYMFKKALQLGQYMKNGFVTREDSFIALKSIALKVIEYPLPATLLDESQLWSIMWQLFQSYLPKSGINRNIVQDVLFGDPKYQGLGITNPFIHQGCKHTNDLCHHLYIQSTTGQFLAIALKHLRIEIGSNISIMQSDPQPYL